MIAALLSVVAVAQFDLQVERAPLECDLRAQADKAFAGVANAWSSPDAPESADPKAWQVTLSLEAATLVVTLRDRAQVLHLTRTVALRPGACATAADSAALIVERYLQAIGWRPSHAALPATEAPPPSALTEPVLVPPTEAVSLVTVGLGTQGELAGAQRRTRLGARLFVAAEAEPVMVQLGVTMYAPERRPLRDQSARVGRYEVTSAAAHLGVGACWPYDGVRGCLLLHVGVEGFTGSAVAERVSDAQTALALRPFAALSMGARQQLSPWGFMWFAELEGFARLSPPTFVVTGAATHYGVPQTGVRASVGLGLLL